MKNRIGTIGGFVLGAGGFLFLFKLLFLDNIPPSDELAPGIVVMLSIATGVVFAFVGSFVQSRLFGKQS